MTCNSIRQDVGNPGESRDQDIVLSVPNQAAEVSCRIEVAAPWGIRLTGNGHPRFHLVGSGECWFGSRSMNRPTALRAGDMVLLSEDEDQALGHVPHGDAIRLDGVVERAARSTGTIRLGGSGDRATIVSGNFKIGKSYDACTEALSSRVRVVRGSKCPEVWSVLARLLEQEMTSASPGGLLLGSQVVGVMLGWLRSAADDLTGVACAERIASTVIAIHREPNRSWSVDELAAICSISRSGFNSHFRNLTGESPMQYLQRCRLARAAGFLERGDARLFQIADWTGYRSDVALSKAFKKRFGVSPGGYRKAARISGQRNALPVS